MINTATLTAEYKRIKAALLADYPELATDEQALADTLEGETQVIEAIAALIRAAEEDDATAEALGGMIEARKVRKERLVGRAEKRRAAAQSLMNMIELRKLTQPDFTASLRQTPWGVRIDYPEAVPDTLCRFTREPNKSAIKTEYQAGRDVPGVTKTNGGETLSVRIK